MNIKKPQALNSIQETFQKSKKIKNYQKSWQIFEMSDKDFQIIQQENRYEIKGATQTSNGWYF